MYHDPGCSFPPLDSGCWFIKNLKDVTSNKTTMSDSDSDSDLGSDSSVSSAPFMRLWHAFRRENPNVDMFSSASSSSSLLSGSDDGEDDSFGSDSSESSYSSGSSDEDHADEERSAIFSRVPSMWYRWDSMWLPAHDQIEYLDENVGSWPKTNWDGSRHTRFVGRSRSNTHGITNSNDSRELVSLSLLRHKLSHGRHLNPKAERKIVSEFLKRPYIQRLIFNLNGLGGMLPESSHAFNILQSDPDREWKSIVFYDGKINDDTFRYAEKIIRALEYVETLAFIKAPTDLALLAEKLLNLRGLRTLFIRHSTNSLTDVRQLTESMERCTRLTKLCIDNCSFDYGEGDSRDGFSTIEDLINGLSRMPQLECIKLSRCGMDDDDVCVGVAAFRKHPSLVHLDFSGNFCYREESVNAIAALLSRKRSKITNLNVSHLWRRKGPFGQPTNMNCQKVFTALKDSCRRYSCVPEW